MRKALIIIGICILLAGMPAMTALSIPNVRSFQRFLPISDNVSNKLEIPSWADGAINGTWGLREYTLLFGMVEIPIGDIYGYYGKLFGPINIFVGQIWPSWNSSKTTNLSGVFFGPVIFGPIGEIDLEVQNVYDIATNETNYVGLGAKNETDFDWRIMSRTGPTFYLKGIFEELE